jgi:hypothetical protein
MLLISGKGDTIMSAVLFAALIPIMIGLRASKQSTVIPTRGITSLSTETSYLDLVTFELESTTA